MIERFASNCGWGQSEFFDLGRTGKNMNLLSFFISQFAPPPSNILW